MKKTYISFIFLVVFPLSILAQNTPMIKLIKVQKPSKAISIKKFDDILIQLNLTLDSNDLKVTTMYSGYIDTVLNGSLILSIDYMRITKKNDFIYQNTFTDYDNNLDIEEQQVEISLDQIDNIIYTSKARENLFYASGFAILLSSATILAIAPLASINYRTGDFNQNRYYTIAGIGLAGLAVSIPLNYFSRSKEYFMNTPINEELLGSDALWEIERY